MTTDNKNIRIVYGTLKEGFRLHTSFDLSNPEVAKKVFTGTLNGFDMYSNGAYPICIRGNGSIVIEVYEIYDKETLRMIDNVELGAGYSVVDIATPFLETPSAKMYIFENHIDYIKQYKKIESGCW